MELITNNKILSTIALAALQQVEDPEIGLNVVDLGLIYQLDFDEEAQKLFCSMTLTTQFCPMGAAIRDNCEASLRNAFPSYTIEVELGFDPPWTADRISEEGRKFLGR